MLDLYMDTTGKRFFEFCFLPKLTEGVHRFVILEEFHFWRFAKRHCFCLISEESFLKAVYGEDTNRKCVSMFLAMAMGFKTNSLTRKNV